MDASASNVPGSTSEMRYSSSGVPRGIPISVLIEPTSTRELDLTNQPTLPSPLSHRRTSSGDNSSSSAHDRRRTLLPVSSLTNPVPHNLAPTRKGQDIAYHSPREGGPDSTTLERHDSAWAASDVARKPRPARPSYSEEQKFFIMFARIIRDHSWFEIEDQFAEIFGQRSKGGLTSVYYRVRRDWGLMEVLKGGPGSFAADCREVEKRALNFSTEFLTQIGYIGRS